MSMRRVLIKSLEGYRSISRTVRRVRGVSEEDAAAQRVVSGQAWDEFCDTLKAAGAAISGLGAPADPLTQAEGYRYLTRLLRAGLEAFLEYNDPRAPVLRRMVHETVKMGSDNPDNHYQNATISGEYDYRLRGTRGSVHFLGLSTQKGGYGQGAGLPPTGFLDSSQLELGPDGELEVILSCREHPGNWLPMEPDTGLLIVRQTFLDKDHETPAELTLERIGGDGLPTPDSAARVDAGLTGAATLVAGASMMFARWAREFSGHANQLPQFDPDRSTEAGGDPDIAYYHSYWRLAPDEALVIEFLPPRCEHWNFQLNNHWMESLDYRYHRIHLNKHSAVHDADGSVRIVVAHEDPGLPNWITTVGRRHGTMCLRWIHAESHPRPGIRLVKLADLRARRV
jgi:hypothetical protein